MLHMSNVIIAAIILWTHIITVHITFMILSHHGVSPEIAGHSLKDILLDGSLLNIGQNVWYLDPKKKRQSLYRKTSY